MNTQLENISEKLAKVYENVAQLYSQTDRREAVYLWQYHVQTVAQNAANLVDRFNSQKDLVVVGALLHDIADIWLDRNDEIFDVKTYETVNDVLRKAGYSSEEINFVKNEIIEPHSCYPDNMPTTLEGKIMATADALAHIQTSFYIDIQKEFRNIQAMSKTEYQQWALKKLERDFNDKIFFDEVKQENEQKYKKLKNSLENL